MSDDLTRLAEIGTATVSDALDRLGLRGSAHGIAPVQDGLRVAGPAFTVRYVPAGFPVGTVGDYVDEVPPGAVVVLDNQGRTDATVWGDILTEFSASRGIAGTAIWGVCRDVATALRLTYPLFTHGRFMRTGKDRVEVADTQVPVALGDAQVKPGDIVVGDDDGTVVIPALRLAEVRDLSETIAAREDDITRAVLDGSTIAAARARFGYHSLQRENP
ncbi:RraA family protein [Pseudonocardia xishanensis]|uniref:Putative 4-hydroxy-4-methyl-2-oxoglutarate aldolase n=1 Tax=Pseudonocardia xishanensis TaxID=630995 RepID=A0ABP8RUJ9_9PSEU